MSYTPGQRWISEAEPELGLGLVIEASRRHLRVVFLAADEERSYAAETAPLSRVQFRIGEVASHGEGWRFKITEVIAADNLLLYRGERDDTGELVDVIETQLAHDMRVSQPQDRLMTNQFDRHREFELRYESLRQRAKLEQSPLRGLLGARVDAIAHQLYIASEVATRPSPRVLLADEVGLGKTVEAGLIIHHQLQTERAQRILIVLPKALISQWLLELMRRFNLPVAVFDEDRCEEAEISTGDNPFLSEQLVICSLDFLEQNQRRVDQAIVAGWDMLVVDEAHHLQWSRESSSLAYQTVEALASTTPGLLLLTATPEQLGIDSHFARLRLLDPNRFSSLDAFIAEEQGYEQAMSAVDSLLSDADIDSEAYSLLQQLEPAAPALAELQAPAARARLLKSLTDRHGTGRVLFRNTRAHIKGFPTRILHSYEMEDETAQVDWLISWLKSHKLKVLVICHQKERAIELEHRLHLREGVLCAAFHEDLGLLARDRAAAWFADEHGAQVLICSEIGSEGRNFQFAQHMIMMDLPSNPDLLEQRIGRLDRIGQQHDIHIHIPYISSGRQAVLFRWYHEGMGAFEHNCRAASVLQAEFGQSIRGDLSDADTDQLVGDTRERLAVLNTAMEKGRDRLLELSSFNAEKAEALVAQFAGLDDYSELNDYFEQICDSFGIDIDDHSDHSFVLHQSSHYRGGFKDLSEDGTTVTFDRATALSNDDFKFLTWEHPLVRDGLDQVLGSSLGNAAIGTLKSSILPEGLVMIECLFSVDVIAPKGLQMGRYMPPQLLRVVVDNEMRSIGKALPFASIKGQVSKVDRAVAKKIVEGQKQLFESMIVRAEGLANAALPKLADKARERLQELFLPEVERMQYLQSVNPSVRPEEVAQMRGQYQQAEAAIAGVGVNLDAIRILIAMH